MARGVAGRERFAARGTAVIIWAALLMDPATHMKTTIEIADGLLEQARQMAARDGTTFRALVEMGLRRVVDERQRLPAFKLRDASFGGEGLQPEAQRGGWPVWRELAYEGRGT